MALSVSGSIGGAQTGLPVSGGIGGATSAPDFSGLAFLNDPTNPYSPYYQAPQAPQQNYATSETAVPSQPGTVAAPTKVIETSPEWLAYINALGLQKDQFAADIARQREIAGGNFAFARAGVEPQYALQRRNITSSAEGRGMLRSGQLQRDLATSRGAENRDYSGIYQNLTNTLSDLQSQLAAKNVDLASQRAQQYGTLLGSGYTSNGTGPGV